MPDVQQNVLIDFQLNNQQLQSTIDLLDQTNKVSSDSVGIYKDVNDQLQKNTQLTQQNAAATANAGSAVSAQQEIYNKLTASLSTLSTAAKSSVQDLLKFSPDKIADGFKSLNITVDEYLNTLKGVSQSTDLATKSTNTLRTQLLQTKNQMSLLAASNLQNTEQYEQLALQAGKLSNILQTQNRVTKNLASDAPIVNAFAEGISGITGAYQAAVGASALFGDTNKDLQETLIKVTSVTAIAQGVQQALNLVKKEGALTTLAVTFANKVAIAQQVIKNGLDSESIVISKAAAVAQKVLNGVLSFNPIAVLVVGIILYVAALYEFTQSSKAAAASAAELNAVLDATGPILDAEIKGLQDAADKQNALLKNQGASQSTILANTGRNLAMQRQSVLTSIAEVNKQLDIASASHSKTASKDYKDASDRLLKLQDQQNSISTDQYKNQLDTQKTALEEHLQDVISLSQGTVAATPTNSTAQFAAQKQLAQAQATLALEQAGQDADKRFAIEQDLQKKIRDINVATQEFIEKDKLAKLQTGAIDAENAAKQISDRSTQAEVDAQKAVLAEELKITLLNVNLTANEKKAAQAKTAQAIFDIQRNFDKEAAIEALQDQDSQAKAILSDVTKSQTEQLNTKIADITFIAQQEIIQNRGKVDKIKEIEARRDADIGAARKSAIDQEAAYELAIFQSTTAAQDRASQLELDKQAQIRNAQGGLGSDTRLANQLGTTQKTVAQQFALIDSITDHQKTALAIQFDALNQNNALGYLSDEEFTKQYTALIDQQSQVNEAAEKKKQDLINETANLQKKRAGEIVNVSLQGVADGLSALSTLYAQQDQADNDRITAQKQRITDLQAAGDISAKQAEARNKALDLQQKQLTLQQAKRNKQMALFQAVINTAIAVTNAITTGDPYTSALRAAIAAAIGAAQIAIIASKPLPQFNKGKKDSYTGFGEVAERSPELVEQDGRMYLVSKPAAVWLGPQDKVYTPTETTKMLESMTFGKNLVVDQRMSHMKDSIDYNRFGKVVADNIPQYGMELTEKGLTEWIKRGNMTTKYLNKKRSWKR